MHRTNAKVNNMWSFTSMAPIDLHDVVLKHRGKNWGMPVQSFKYGDFKPSDVAMVRAVGTE